MVSLRRKILAVTFFVLGMSLLWFGQEIFTFCTEIIKSITIDGIYRLIWIPLLAGLQKLRVESSFRLILFLVCMYLAVAGLFGWMPFAEKSDFAPYCFEVNDFLGEHNLAYPNMGDSMQTGSILSLPCPVPLGQNARIELSCLAHPVENVTVGSLPVGDHLGDDVSFNNTDTDVEVANSPPAGNSTVVTVPLGDSTDNASSSNSPKHSGPKLSIVFHECSPTGEKVSANGNTEDAESSSATDGPDILTTLIMLAGVYFVIS
eukprot:373568_1